MSQITTCSVFRMKSSADKWWAFKQMRYGLKKLQGTEGLVFYKIMGSGADDGFSILPNLSVYVLFAVWKSEDYVRRFFANHAFYKEYCERSNEHFVIYAYPAKLHGSWDGQQPFEPHTQVKKGDPVMVLTRATIRRKKLISFWRRVHRVSESLKKYPGVLFSIGVGEWPLIQQATISIWNSQDEMIDYAYKNEKHKNVVKLTKKLGWYSEEMFSRFLPYRIEGIWHGIAMDKVLNQNRQ